MKIVGFFFIPPIKLISNNEKKEKWKNENMKEVKYEGYEINMPKRWSSKLEI